MLTNVDCAGYVVLVTDQINAHTTPSAPKRTNGPGSPPAASNAGAASKPIIEPLWKPPMDTATARDRSDFGTHREMILFMHGNATPSPNPMIARVSKRNPKLPFFATNGV